MIPHICACAPGTLWVELTSKCPADCLETHLPFTMFEIPDGRVRDARRITLNYSGESTVYPVLTPAVQRATGRRIRRTPPSRSPRAMQ